MIKVNRYILDSLCHYIPETTDPDYPEVWWAPVIGGGEGYIMVWADGEHLHTYRNPSDWYGKI